MCTLLSRGLFTSLDAAVESPPPKMSLLSSGVFSTPLTFRVKHRHSLKVHSNSNHFLHSLHSYNVAILETLTGSSIINYYEQLRNFTLFQQNLLVLLLVNIYLSQYPSPRDAPNLRTSYIYVKISIDHSVLRTHQPILLNFLMIFYFFIVVAFALPAFQLPQGTHFIRQETRYCVIAATERFR